MMTTTTPSHYVLLQQHETNVREMTTRALRAGNLDDMTSDFFNGTHFIHASGNVSMNMNMTQYHPAPTFTEVSLTKTVVYSVLFLISFVGNTATLCQMYRLRRRKSTINTLIVNLAIADLLVTFFCIAGEAAWAATVQWKAGNISCKFVKYMQVFALYLSTYITVAIGLDRCVAIIDPMRWQSAAQRVRIMMIAAWVCSALFSIPQAVLFHVLRGPFKEEFYQCVTFGSYKEEWQRQLYSIASLLFMFIIPLVIIGTAYGLIFTTISRKSREVSVLDSLHPLNGRKSWVTLWHHYRSACLCGDTCDPRLSREESIVSSCSGENGRGPVRSNLLRRAKRKSLRMSVVIVLAFVLCWSPYYIMFICITFLGWKEIQPRTHLWFSVVGLSYYMLTPMIYGAFQLCKVHKPRSSRRDEWHGSSLKVMGGRSAHRTMVPHPPGTPASTHLNTQTPTHTHLHHQSYNGGTLRHTHQDGQKMDSSEPGAGYNSSGSHSGGSGSCGSRGLLLPVCRCDVCVSERRHQQQLRMTSKKDRLRHDEDNNMTPTDQRCIRFTHKHFQSGDAERCCLFHSY